jgi:hypothetical protein
VVPSPFRLFINLAVAAVVAFIVFSVAFIVLGGEDLGPSNVCRNAVSGEGRPVQRDVSQAQVFQQSWDSINAQLAGGAAEVTLPFSESEVTSRASQFLDERDAPVDDLVICFHDGYAEARATVGVPGGSGIPLIGGVFDTTARITGTLDLSGEHPRLVITDFDAGRLPGIAEDAIRDHVEDEVNERLAGLTLRYTYTSLTFTEGTATITATATVPE